MLMNWVRNLIELPKKLEEKFGTLYFILINLIPFGGKNAKKSMIKSKKVEKMI